MADQSQWIQITSAGGTFEGYLAVPQQTPAPAVVVIQEIFGVNSHIRSVCDRFAAEGFVALAPDVYWRVQPHIELGYEPEDIAKGRDIRGKLADDDVVEDVRATLEALQGRPESSGEAPGIVGFCWGGLVTYMAGTRLQPGAVSSFYGGGIVNYLGEIGGLKAPTQFHFGELDQSIPLDHVDQLREALKPNLQTAGDSQLQGNVTVYVYPGAQHGFHCDQRGSYNEASARQAWQRTIELFKTHLT